MIAVDAPDSREQLGLVLAGVARSWLGQPVLTDVNLRVDPGRLVSIVGANGAGKTTLLRILAGILAPDAGTVVLGGRDLGADARAYRRQIGFLSAGDRTLYARLTVRQNLDFCARLAVLRGERRERALQRAIARFELEPLATRRADRLSLGQRQRVRLAAAFVHDPALVLLDEPTASLDADAQRLLDSALRELAGRGAAAIWSTPVSQERLSADRRLSLERGTLVQR